MIVVLAGRRIDAENTDCRRFPKSEAETVKEKVRDFFKNNNVIHLVSSGACGADILAQEVALELNIHRTIILPFEANSFRNTSVTDRPGDWGKRYDKLIENLSGNLIILNYDQHDPAVYEKTNFELLETAAKLSAQYGTSDVTVLILWEGKPKDSDDSTLGLKMEAQRRSLETKEISTVP